MHIWGSEEGDLLNAASGSEGRGAGRKVKQYFYGMMCSICSREGEKRSIIDRSGVRGFLLHISLIRRIRNTDLRALKILLAEQVLLEEQYEEIGVHKIP